VKSDLAPRLVGFNRFEQLPNGFKQGGYRFVVTIEAFFEFSKLLRQSAIGGNLFAHIHEGPNDPDAGFDGHWTVQNAGKHDSAMLSEGGLSVSAAAVT